jgi:hypothetical protein
VDSALVSAATWIAQHIDETMNGKKSEEVVPPENGLNQLGAARVAPEKLVRTSLPRRQIADSSVRRLTMTEDRREYARRLQRSGHSPNFTDDSVVREMLLQLDRLERQTDPQHPDSDCDKDASANKALRIVSELCDYVSGWAMDHKIGLAIEGFGNIPDLAMETRTSDYKELRKSVNSHQHEAAGQSRDLASGVQRKALSNLFNAMSSPRVSLWDPLAEALLALEYGETRPILEPVKGGLKKGFRELTLQLFALCFIEYKRGLGGRKYKLLAEVEEAFGVSPDTVRGWGRWLPKQLDPFYVARALSRAKRCAEVDRDNASPNFDQTFGKAALSKWGAEYKDVPRFRKTQR